MKLKRCSVNSWYNMKGTVKSSYRIWFFDLLWLTVDILEIISNMIQSGYLQHWYPFIIFYTLRIQSEIRAQHGQHGSTQWRDCVECCCRWFGREDAHMLTCKTRSPSGLVLHILNTSPGWIKEFLDIHKKHRSGLYIAFSIFPESPKNCTHRPVCIRWIQRRNDVLKSITQQKEA